jgi:hypothetical protein
MGTTSNGFFTTPGLRLTRACSRQADIALTSARAASSDRAVNLQLMRQSLAIVLNVKGRRPSDLGPECQCRRA